MGISRMRRGVSAPESYGKWYATNIKSRPRQWPFEKLCQTRFNGCALWRLHMAAAEGATIIVRVVT